MVTNFFYWKNRFNLSLNKNIWLLKMFAPIVVNDSSKRNNSATYSTEDVVLEIEAAINHTGFLYDHFLWF